MFPINDVVEGQILQIWLTLMTLELLLLRMFQDLKRVLLLIVAQDLQIILQFYCAIPNS